MSSKRESKPTMNLQEIRQEGMEGAAVATYCSLSLRLSGKSSQHHRQEKNEDTLSSSVPLK